LGLSYLAAVVVQGCEVADEHHPMEVEKVGGAFLVVVTVLSQVVVMGFEEFLRSCALELRSKDKNKSIHTHTEDVVCAFEHVVGA